MVLHKCSECVYHSKRKFDLKRHLKNVHGFAKNVIAPIESSAVTSQLCDRMPRPQSGSELEDGLYSEQEYQQCMSTLRTRFPTIKLDTIDPRFIHPFTAIIAGPSSSESQCFACD